MGDKVLDLTREQMLADIAEALKPFEPDPDWFTCAEMAKLWGVPHKKAQYRLESLVEEGVLERHKIGWHVYYERIEEDD